MPKRKDYDQKALESAITDVQNGLSKKAAAKKYGVPRATIQFRLSTKFVKSSCGPSTVLTTEEESLLEDWITKCARKGFPRRKDDILQSVKEFIDTSGKITPFTDNVPGKSWYKGFLSRHPNISLRESEAVTRASASLSEKDIRKWFEDITNYLRDENAIEILKDPTRVYNGDETNFVLCPKTCKVLAIKGTKNVYEVDQGKAKEAVTCMFSFSASGGIVPPMIIYPYVRVPKDIVQSVPDSWGIGHSTTGWMKSEVFYEYIANIFNPFLSDNNITKPVILFVDGHKTHLSYNLSQLCNELGIILIALYPNSTRILQPADVAAFKPIKNGWKKGVLNWRRTHINDAINKTNVAPILKHVIDQLNTNILVNGFKACGLFPWDPNQIDFTKCLGKNKKETLNRSDATMSLESFEDICGDDLVNKFKNIEHVVLHENLPSEFYTLYKVWETFITYNSSDIEPDRPTDCSTISTAGPSNHTHVNTSNDVAISNASEVERVSYTKVNSKQTITNSSKEPAMQDHTYATPTKNKRLNSDSQSVLREISEPRKRMKGLENSGSSLSDVLLWPDTPKRKGKRNIERVPYVVSSHQWQTLHKEKEDKKILEETEKLERKRKREEKKNAGNVERQKTLSRKVLKYKPNTKTSLLSNSICRPNNCEKLKKQTLVKCEPGCSRDNNFTVKLEKTELERNITGLCYKCGGNFKKEGNENKVECDLCDKTFHTMCVDDINIDEAKSTSIFVCKDCLKYSEDIVDSLKIVL